MVMIDARQVSIPGHRHLALLVAKTPAQDLRDSKCPVCRNFITDGSDDRAAQIAVHDASCNPQAFDSALATVWGHYGCVNRLFDIRGIAARGVLLPGMALAVPAPDVPGAPARDIAPEVPWQRGRQRDFLDYLLDVLAPGSDVVVNHDRARGQTERYRYRVLRKKES